MPGRFFENKSSAVVRQALGGWQLAGITTSPTGEPATVGSPGDSTGAGGAGTRPDLIDNLNHGPKNGTMWFNTSAFAVPAGLS